MSAAPVRLDECEWKFDAIPETELEACFWWEYLRSGLDSSLRTDLRATYIEARKWWDDGGLQQFSDFICDSPRGTVRKRFAKPVVLLRFLASEEIFWVANAGGKRPDQRRPADFFFDRSPWLKLSEAAREHLARAFPSSFGSVLLLDLHRSVRDEELPTELPPQLKGYRPKSVGRVEFARDVPADFRTSWFAVQVDWRFRDAAIVSALTRLLAQRRPSNCPEPKQGDAGSIAQNALGSTRTIRGALSALGVFRAREALPNWNTYRKTYANQSEDTHLNAQVRRAKGVIAWMRDGNEQHLKELIAATRRMRVAREKRARMQTN